MAYNRDPKDVDPASGLSVVIARCDCGWFDYYFAFTDSPSTCPRCAADLVIRNQTDMDEIIYPDTGKLFLNTAIPAVGQNLYIDPDAPTDNWEGILAGDAEE